MRSMSNLEYHRICAELKPLIGGRLDKFYDMGEGEFRLRFRIPGKHEDVSVKLGERIHLTKYIRDAPKEPSNLSMHLRKRLSGARLLTVEQHRFDRVLVLGFSGEEGHSLVFEMFAEGNLILLDSKGKIIRCLRREEWKDRILKEGQEYKFPASDRLSPPFQKGSLAQRLATEQKSLISFLVSKTNFGNDCLEEACRRAGLDLRKTASELGEDGAGKLALRLNEIYENPHPIIYLKEEKPFDYSLASLHKHSGLESRAVSSLSEAVDECANAGAEAVAAAPEPEKAKKKQKLQLRLEKQEERVLEMQKEAEELKKQGDGIYARYNEAESILKEISEMRKAGKGWPEVKKALAGRCEIDEHRGVVILRGQS